jgi:diacylglycerol kinase family enzyme
LRLSAGDLLRTVGGPREPTAEAALLPADLASVLLDGRQHWFVAHLVARRHWWRGRIVAVMNAQFLGAWDVAPRGHPNDGRLDVVDVAASMTLRDRWHARHRLPTGTHLPHPDIAVQQVTAWQTMLPPGTGVWLDGRAMGEVRNVSVRVEPDALLLVL